jgi:hypothetical protein
MMTSKPTPRFASVFAAFLGAILILTSSAFGQTRKNFFQPGEQLVYKVKYGFIKLGTVVIQTGQVHSDGSVDARMQFFTADNPFLSTKTTVTDQFANDLTLKSFSEQTVNGDEKKSKQMIYDQTSKMLTYSDESIKNKVTGPFEAFDDALGLFMNMRAWSGAVGHKYKFHMRGKDGERPATVEFTNQTSMEQVPALDDKEVKTRVLNGMTDMGGSSPLGADGAFTAYVSDDDAAIPVRIDMKIALGSISLVLDKVKRNDWAAAK